MFPFNNSPFSFVALDQYQAQLYSQTDFINQFGPIGNYYYFSPFQSVLNNMHLGQFSSSTQYLDGSICHFSKSTLQQDHKKTQSKIENFNRQSQTDQKGESRVDQISEANIKNQNHLLFSRKVTTNKLKKSKILSKYHEQEYSADDQNKRRTDDQIHLYLKYRRKNTESNIVNRIYSFLISEFKNKKEVLRLKLTDQKKETFLKYLMTIVDAWKGPVKRQLLHSLMNINETLPAYKAISRIQQTQGILTLEEFSYLNRVLIKVYLSKIAGVSIVTSKKMKKAVWRQHLQKIRELNDYFFNFQENER